MTNFGWDFEHCDGNGEVLVDPTHRGEAAMNGARKGLEMTRKTAVG
jgi:hypothetical protein